MNSVDGIDIVPVIEEFEHNGHVMIIDVLFCSVLRDVEMFKKKKRYKQLKQNLKFNINPTNTSSPHLII